ncbi:MAG: SMC-Scp complex subunit ScpB [Planctomycetes bacterium]|nr:SMC-Scp complex subunit ScpB [Planctomycetota bacterium]
MTTDGERPDEPESGAAVGPPPAPLDLPTWELDVEAPELASAAQPTTPVEETPPAPSGSPAAEVKEEQAPPPLLRILEAMLFVGGAPLTAVRACDAIRGLSPDEFQQAIDLLERNYRSQGRPYTIQLQEQGYVLTLRPRYAGIRERLYGGPREARLSPAAVDVLSLVAYQQPATRQEIDSLRGADSGAVLRQLVRHGLVALQRGHDDREAHYVTTQRFLELFHLRSLEDLPQTQDLQRL